MIAVKAPGNNNFQITVRRDFQVNVSRPGAFPHGVGGE